MQLALGADIATVKELLGHANIAQTLTYAKIVDENKKKAANPIRDAKEEPPKPPPEITQTQTRYLGAPLGNRPIVQKR